MSLDFEMNDGFDSYSGNITHNCNVMASELGIYFFLWRAEEMGIKKAKSLILPLRYALILAQEKYYMDRLIELEKKGNGWGTVKGFLKFITGILEFAEKHPKAKIRTSK